MNTPELHAVAIAIATELVAGAADVSVIVGLVEDLPGEARELLTLVRFYADSARSHGPESLRWAGLEVALLGNP